MPLYGMTARIASGMLRITWLFTALVLFLSLPLSGQTLPGLAEKTAQEDSPNPPIETVPAERASPRATMRTFLVAMSERDWNRAIATLDLGHENLTGDVLATRGREVATQLKKVMDRVAFVRYEEIPEDAGGQSR